MTPLKLRLEISKRISNLRLDFLQRLYDRRPIIKRYVRGYVNFHLHSAKNGVRCVTFIANDLTQVSVRAGMDCGVEQSCHLDEMPVFVGIGGFPQVFRPVASLIRLQPLNGCNMRGVNAFEAGLATVAPEVIYRVHNRELCSALLAAGVEFGEFENEIIQSAPKVITNLAEADRDISPDECLIGRRSAFDAIRRLRIKVYPDGVCLADFDVGEHAFEVIKMFAAPPYSCNAGVKWVQDVCDHD